MTSRPVTLFRAARYRLRTTSNGFGSLGPRALIKAEISARISPQLGIVPPKKSVRSRRVDRPASRSATVLLEPRVHPPQGLVRFKKIADCLVLRRRGRLQ